MTPRTNRAKGLECKQVCVAIAALYFCVSLVVDVVHVIILNCVCLTGRVWCERATRSEGKILIMSLYVILDWTAKDHPYF